MIVGANEDKLVVSTSDLGPRQFACLSLVLGCMSWGILVSNSNKHSSVTVRWVPVPAEAVFAKGLWKYLIVGVLGGEV